MRLQKKFLAWLVPTIVLVVAIAIVSAKRAVETVIVGGVERAAVLIARAKAVDAAQGLEAGRETDILPHLQDLRHWKGALYASVLDLQGRIVAHTTISERGKLDDDPFIRAALLSDEPRTRRTALEGKPVLVVAAPVWARSATGGGEEFLLTAGASKRLGALKLVVSLEEALKTVKSIIREIALILLATALIVIGLIMLLLRGVLAPISGLMEGIARVAAGDYNVSVPATTRDELGDLARSFNAMSRELARTTVSKEYVESVLENMYDLLVVTDADGRIRTVNHAAAAVLGDGELIGRPIASVFDSAPRLGVVRDEEVVLRAKDGGRMPALYSSSALLDAGGRPLGYIGVAKDITSRKRAEKELLAAKLAAEAANRELEAFSYSVAHDLRAPLRAVDGFSQILLEKYSDKLDETGKEYFRRVRAGSVKMGRLIDDLLELSRITRGTLTLRAVDLTALALAVAEELRRAEPGRVVEFVIAPGLTARGDASLLRIALVNLLGNAWKYTSRHARARIEFGSQRRGGETVYFVRDDGAGFDMAFVKRLFQPFTRLHAAAEFEGTGIGLAIVARVVARHAGRIWGEGAVEKGAVFYFTLGETIP